MTGPGRYSGRQGERREVTGEVVFEETENSEDGQWREWIPASLSATGRAKCRPDFEDLGEGSL